MEQISCDVSLPLLGKCGDGAKFQLQNDTGQQAAILHFLPPHCTLGKVCFPFFPLTVLVCSGMAEEEKERKGLGGGATEGFSAITVLPM